MIRINGEGDGAWIAAQVEAIFHPGIDQAFTSVVGGERQGGIILQNYATTSIFGHMAGINEKWCTRELLWMVSDYIFNQIGCTKFIAQCRSNNWRSNDIVQRGGFVYETRINSVYPGGVDLVFYVMTYETCPWLRIVPKGYKSGTNRRSV